MGTKIAVGLDFGGIRIEDNLLVTDTDPDVITGDVPVLG